MNMTHYMELLATNQPWHLIIFMAIPVIFAETVTITEFAIIFNRLTHGPVKTLNKIASILAGLYFTGIFLYMVTTVVPTIEWRGAVDFIAVWSYLSGVIFLGGLALLELNIIAKNKTVEQKMKIHFILVAGFLIVAHVAMIFGMVDPSLFQHGANAGMNMNM